MQGIVRVPFGAWWSPFLCVDPSSNKANHRLACVEHTATGIDIGAFSTLDVVVEVAEVATRMHDWRNLDSNKQASLDLMRRVRIAWSAAGVRTTAFQAYPTVDGSVPVGMPQVGIFAKPPTEQPRPKKLWAGPRRLPMRGPDGRHPIRR
ncbi:hypothetical protein AC629_26275 [Bradyrhizobium sp. NAS80.1]|uniref:hypothetical protein n=1 Tax=Bradyrhizobium sp. NAS80.1 TaxID=1680159 RepID=UPI000966373D|nr:hypothetical protein [Bradyrhizobium sp. NAS80.1]OKO80983.1 hypothetical protein AC629_26275 [Bradyrhizobium sp. NAS80.1]